MFCWRVALACRERAPVLINPNRDTLRRNAFGNSVLIAAAELGAGVGHGQRVGDAERPLLLWATHNVDNPQRNHVDLLVPNRGVDVDWAEFEYYGQHSILRGPRYGQPRKWLTFKKTRLRALSE